MKQIPIIALGLALVIIVSACTEERAVAVTPNDGLYITEFSSDASRFTNRESISLYLEVENRGGTTARNIEMEIIGASWVSKPTNTVVSLDPPDMSIKPPIPGETAVFSTFLDPYTRLPEGVEANIDLSAKVKYDYSSNGVAIIPVINKDEYRSRVRNNRPIPSTKNVSNSHGPIHIDIDERGLDPLIAGSEEGIAEDASVTIYINNVGSGAPITDNELGKISVTLEIMGSNAVFKECLGNSAYSGNVIYGIPITLGIRDQFTIPCKISFRTPQIQDAISIHFATNYKYFIEKPLKITIVGAPLE